MDEFFYGTLPQDTQDFSQVLRGVGRSIGDIGRGVSYYPHDLVGAPVDLINMALTPVGLGSEQPVLGSDYLRNIAQSLGFAQPSTGSGAETAGRFGAAFVNPAAGARAVGQLSQGVTRGANLSADRLVQMITGNPQATAPRVLEETSMPFMQAVAPKAPAVPGLMEPAKSDIGFYSQLEAATIPLQNKGTGDQYLAQIQKSAGVKPEEIQWTGLDEFLKGKKSVTKTEIQDYLNANRVDVREVKLGGAETQPKPVTLDEARQFLAQDPDRYIITNEYGGRFRPERIDLAGDQQLFVSEGTKETKFSSYTLPGGENYREILLTLPTSGSGGKRVRVYTQDGTSAVQVMSDADIQRMAESGRRKFEVLDEVSPQGTFQSTHFDQPNILAHMRVNDRVVDGKKTLFVEEVQSDWHQAGRKRGYSEPGKPFEVFDPRDGNVISRFATESEAKEYADQLGPQVDYARSEGVPDAPFKTSWHELTLKRAIQEASEKGYDQIAFTTGKTQAERYDLSKQISEVHYSGTNLKAYDKSGNEVISRTGVGESDLEDYIGKEAARKLLDQPKQGTLRSLVGQELQVGGEGMKGFYDQILPKSLEKLGKKFDAKVGKTEMDGVEVWQMDITPKMRESVTTKGQPLFAVPAVGAGLLGAGMYQDEQMF